MKEKLQSQSRPIWEYKVVVFDLDGTLYFQPALRAKMAWKLFRYYIVHPFRIKEVFVVKKFREVVENWDAIGNNSLKNNGCDVPDDASMREEESGQLAKMQYAYVSKEMKCSPDAVEGIVERWMYSEPLFAIYQTRDTEILKLIDELRKSEVKVAVLSDYPAVDKLKALKLSVDGIYAATDEAISELKPSPKGLQLIMRDFDCAKNELLMIGDRYSKDGMAAVNAGCDYIILNRRKCNRNFQRSVFSYGSGTAQ